MNEAPTPAATPVAPVRPYKLLEPDGSGRVRLFLLHGITLGTERTEELVFRRAKGKDMRGMRFLRQPDGSTVVDAGLMLDFAAKLCGKTPPHMDELEGLDLEFVMEVAGDFFSSGPGTGPS